MRCYAAAVINEIRAVQCTRIPIGAVKGHAVNVGNRHESGSNPGRGDLVQRTVGSTVIIGYVDIVRAVHADSFEGDGAGKSSQGFHRGCRSGGSGDGSRGAGTGG